MSDISTPKPPKNASAVIVLADGSVFYGQGIGAETKAVGEICFNSADYKEGRTAFMEKRQAKWQGK